MSPPSRAGGPAVAAGSGGWLRTLHQWHWISSALALVGMMLFAITGITLNHASQIESKPSVSRQQARLPAPLLLPLKSLASHDGSRSGGTGLPPEVLAWLGATWGVRADDVQPEWSTDEVYIAMPRPGGDAWVRIDLGSGEAEYEVTDRGWISWLNDLHKGRHAGALWGWFIDAFAVVCLVFCVTGLLILKSHAARRPGTWPVVGLGLLLPALIAILFIH